MKAWRLYNGQITETVVDVDEATGQPILPPDTTVAPRPDAIDGHYLTIQGNNWVQIQIPAPSFFQLQSDKRVEFEGLRQRYMDKPVDVNGTLFDADETARTRLSQALTMFQTFAYIPPTWIRQDNTPHPLASVDDLKTIALAVMTAFSTRFYELTTVRDAINNATTKEELDAIVMPVVE